MCPMQSRLNVVSLQPFYGGSHRAFIDGWITNSVHDWTNLTLPARHWKWRMRHAAITFAEALTLRIKSGQQVDLIVATDMLNVAEFKSLLMCRSGRQIPVVLYFHENQFSYPSRFSEGSVQRERDEHFGFTNFVSALAADACWFNSNFNRSSFLAELNTRLQRWPDHPPTDSVKSLESQATIQHPGIEQPIVDLRPYDDARFQRAVDREPIHLVWAARWEHDKGPARLLTALRRLKQRAVPFRVSIIGESFSQIPQEFETMQREFDSEIMRWGFQSSREQYWRALAEGDLFLSTAEHEFFGLSACESIVAGLYPLLPNRLAYPELLSLTGRSPVEPYLSAKIEQEADALVDQIVQLSELRLDHPKTWNPGRDDRDRFLAKLCWTTRSKEMDAELAALFQRLA
ncbi:MAG: DUF3524 domain-containing protein [Planctomycetota bacterium]